MANAEQLAVIVDEPILPATAAVVWMHGLGASADNFLSCLPILRAQGALDQVRFLFPDAPVQAVTVNGGMPMQAWYDIFGFSHGVKQDVAGIRRSAERLTAVIQGQLAQGIPSNRIVIMGFSQGGAMALHLGLRFPQKLAAIFSLSGYLPVQEYVAAERHAANAATPVTFFHGTKDDIVPFEWARSAQTYLEELSYTTQLYEYPIAHTLSMDELQQIRSSLQEILMGL